MKLIHVDLYDYFGKIRPAAAAGYLSCYLPSEVHHPGCKRLRPAILVIPGGGYGGVSDREAEPVALRFLTKGYGAFVLNYSVAPVRFPHALREAAMAMRYIRENAAELGIIKNMVAATGFSAGGHLCGTLGMMFDAPELQDIAPAEMGQIQVIDEKGTEVQTMKYVIKTGEWVKRKSVAMEKAAVRCRGNQVISSTVDKKNSLVAVARARDAFLETCLESGEYTEDNLLVVLNPYLL